MIELPYAYKGNFDVPYEILGWKGNVLQTRCRDRVWTLTRADTLGLLKHLGLKESDIPGKVEYPIPTRKKWEGWDDETVDVEVSG